KPHGVPQQRQQNDQNVYCLGEIGGHFVVMAGLPQGEYGTNSANTVAMHLQMSFLNIQYGIFVESHYTQVAATTLGSAMLLLAVPMARMAGLSITTKERFSRMDSNVSAR